MERSRQVLREQVYTGIDGGPFADVRHPRATDDDEDEVTTRDGGLGWRLEEAEGGSIAFRASLHSF